MQEVEDGWQRSAEAWIAELGEAGDYSRRYVLDTPMLDRIKNRGFENALDVGCGEGRFCRLMRQHGLKPVGVDPTATLIDRARALDASGDYHVARAEDMDLPPDSFDLVVSYLTLIDIPDIATAIAKMAAALRSGGVLLVANLTSFNTAGMPQGWQANPDGSIRFSIDGYLNERAIWTEWGDIRILNWHRPLSTYMKLFLENGFELRHFSEPEPHGGDPARGESYRRVPWFHIMEWQKR